VAVDLADGAIAGQAQAVTTVETDITTGLQEALRRLWPQLGGPTGFAIKLGCSSARGGLRVIAIGLVPELTAEAAKRAALGAGARILAVYAHHLTHQELREIVVQAPDMILLAGGTDGGDWQVICHNAHALASSPVQAPIVVAGNKDVAGEVQAILQSGGKEALLTENVMPRLGQINVEPARRAIRQLFMEKIVEAKGLGRAEAFVACACASPVPAPQVQAGAGERVLMPTPAAVLRAAQLLAEGSPSENGLGEMMVVDVGGATTDVHSIALGETHRPPVPASHPHPPLRSPFAALQVQAKVIQRGLPEPYAKRTVEGDLGLRVSAASLLQAVGVRRLREDSGLGEDVDLAQMAWALINDVGHLPQTPEEEALDAGMARAAVRLSVERHVGALRELFLPTGTCFVQEGKDLTGVAHLIGTGGIFAHTPRPSWILREALFDPANPLLLKPMAPHLWNDRRYILWAMGLLAETAPDIALRIMLRHLEEIC
jgi:hypothetical protein